MSRHHHPKQPERMACTDIRCRCTRGEDGTRCRQCSYGAHCGSHAGGCHRSCAGPFRAYGFRRFEGYRPDEPDRAGLGAPGSGPRFEGVVFSDGTCVLRWRGEIKSTSVFQTFSAMMKAHGHPEYGTVIKWLDALPEPASSEKGTLWSPDAAGWVSASTVPRVTRGTTRSTSSRSRDG